MSKFYGAALVPRVYDLLERCVTDGVAGGYRAAHAYTDTPSPESLQDAIVDRVLLVLSERFVIPDQFADDQ